MEVEIDELKAETEKAWLVVVEGDPYWVPKSKCELDEEASVLTIPSWMAKKHGFGEE